MPVQWFRTWQRFGGRRRQTAVRRCLAVFLLLAFAASAAFGVAVSSQASLAASTAHGHSIANDGGNDPCCPEQKSHTPDGTCVSAGGCSLWVAVGAAPTFMPPDGELVHAGPATAGSGAVPFPHFHPPKLSARV